MDIIDKKILYILQTDTSLPLSTIAKKVGLSTTPCFNRIKKLEEEGIIKKRVAIIDNNKINLPIIVFLSISVAQHSKEWLEEFVNKITSLKEVVEKEAIVVIEDIVDTGTTLLKIDEIFKAKGVEWQIASLFFKPQAYKGRREIDFVGFEIPNDFIVGYGLDYDGFGRNLKNVYQLAKA